MGRELENQSDIEQLSAEWSQKPFDQPPKIKRIEDLPDLPDISGLNMRWVIDGILAEGALHMLTSEPGHGKSTWISAAAYAVSHGLPFMGRATTKRLVLMLDAENPLPAIHERFQRLAIHTNLDFRIWGQWVGEDAPAAGGGIVTDWVSRCDPKPLIVVDSVIAFHPGAENDSKETRQYMEQYRTLTAMGATVVLLHHTGKSETSKDYRGSSDYKASIDIGYKLTNLGDGTRLAVLEIRPFKQRFTVEPMLRISYKDGVFTIDEHEPRKSNAERLRELLQENPGITKSDFEVLAAKREIGRNRARDYLENGLKGGTIRAETGRKNSRLHYLKEAEAG